MTTNTQTSSVDSLIALYAKDIAFVTEEQPATTVDDFISQLQSASFRLGTLHFTDAEDLDTAATYLADARDSEGDEQHVLLKKAADYLRGTDDMVDEYRLMV